MASALTEAFPARIDRVIYLAAYRLQNGHPVSQYFMSDRHSLLFPYVSVDKLKLRDRFDPAIYTDELYHGCSASDRALAGNLLYPEPLRPTLTKVRLTQERAGCVPTGYIGLTEGRCR